MVIDSIPKAVGMGFAVLVSLLVVVLLLRGKFNRRIGLVLLVASALMGFLVFAPMLPNQFQVLLLGKTKQLGVPVPLAGAVLFLFVAMTLRAGKVVLRLRLPHRSGAGIGLSTAGEEADPPQQEDHARLSPGFPRCVPGADAGILLGDAQLPRGPRFLLPGLHLVLPGLSGDRHSGRVPLPAILPPSSALMARYCPWRRSKACSSCGGMTSAMSAANVSWSARRMRRGRRTSSRSATCAIGAWKPARGRASATGGQAG